MRQEREITHLAGVRGEETTRDAAEMYLGSIELDGHGVWDDEGNRMYERA